MIGTDLESDSRPQFVAAAMLVASAVLLAVGLAVQNGSWALAGLMPFAIGAMLWLMKGQPFAAKLTERGIVIQPTGDLIAYDSMQAVWPTAAGHRSRTKGKGFGFVVQHGGGVLSVPASLNVRSEDVFKFLAANIPRRRIKPATPAVAEYMDRQISVFGDDHVWSFAARTQRVSPGSAWYRGSLMMLGIVTVGVVWCAAGAIMRSEGWTAFGVLAVVLGLLFALLFFIAAKGAASQIKNWQSASLVISPVGFALAQGDLCGELRWKEIRSVRLRLKPGSLFTNASARGQGVVVHVEGADILIADLYDAPLEAIHERIEQLWRHGE